MPGHGHPVLHNAPKRRDDHARTILHCDCNAFYASVETLLDPSLAAGPMAVCGDPESRHGIILAKNEAAKAYGVQTAETIWQAKRKCPDLRLVPPHREEYVRYSRLANQLYLEYTDLVEPFGIDESFLDVTGTLPPIRRRPGHCRRAAGPHEAGNRTDHLGRRVF